MSIGFSFTGKVHKKDALLERIREIAKQQNYDLYEAEDRLRLELCPIGGDLYINWKYEKGLFGHWIVQGNCQSTPAGAGFHKAAVDVLDKLEIKNLSVDDETGYYEHRDFDRMRKEHFYPWLNSLVELCQREEDLSNICLCWDMSLYMPESIDNTIVTPMGRFTKNDINEIVKQLGIRALAERFFLWNEPEKDARFYCNLAINLLWERCYFAPSSRSEEDKKINAAIIENLEKAATLNPSLPLPREAYKEICELDNHTPSLPEGFEFTSSFPTGFRKGLITHSFGDLRFVLPGIYKYEWEAYDDNNGVSMWWDSSSNSPIWRVSGWRKQTGEAEFTPHLNELNDVEEREITNGRAKWGWAEFNKDDGIYWQIQCEVLAGPALYFLTATYLDKEDKADIIELLKKLSAAPREQKPVNKTYTYN